MGLRWTPSLGGLLSGALMLTCISGAAYAQQGHPLAGTWSGYWESTAGRNRVLLLLDYDGESITGVINPGRRPAPLTRAALDPISWTVTLEGSREGDDGSIVHIVIEGQIENLTSTIERTITGTWIQGETRGALRVTLN